MRDDILIMDKTAEHVNLGACQELPYFLFVAETRVLSRPGASYRLTLYYYCISLSFREFHEL